MSGPVLWSASAIAEATGGEVVGGAGDVSGISIDTRSITPGDLFVALQGENRDGHAFVADALAGGAAAALVARRPDDLPDNAPLIVVGDTLEALTALGRAGRARSAARVIAVTGSVGKTTTKEMLRVILADQGRVHAAERSFNNHWGVPLTLARMPVETEFAVLEIGMNHPGEIAPLSRLARPHVAVITCVEAVHLAAFESVAAIADAKAEIFAGLEDGGTAVLQAGSRFLDRLAAAAGGARIVTFGAEPSDFQLLEAVVSGTITMVRASTRGVPHRFRIGAPGAHLAHNAMAALAAADAVGADIVRAGLSLGRWRVSEGRGVRWRVSLGPGGLDGEITLIDESYNANPASVRAALSVLAAAPVQDGIGRVSRGRRIAFLGDMLELGEAEIELHASLAEVPEIEGIDVVHCCGTRMRSLWEALPRERRGHRFPDSAEMAGGVRRLVDAGDVCMVKGSNGAHMDRVVRAIKLLGTASRADISAEE